MDVQVHEYEYGSTLETTPSVLSMEHSEVDNDGYENEFWSFDLLSQVMREVTEWKHKQIRNYLKRKIK